MIEIIMIGAIVAAASLITLWILGHVKESKKTNIIAWICYILLSTSLIGIIIYAMSSMEGLSGIIMLIGSIVAIASLIMLLVLGYIKESKTRNIIAWICYILLSMSLIGTIIYAMIS